MQQQINALGVEDRFINDLMTCALVQRKGLQHDWDSPQGLERDYLMLLPSSVEPQQDPGQNTVAACASETVHTSAPPSDTPVGVQDTQEEAGEEQDLDQMEEELDVQEELQPGTSDIQANTSQPATAPATTTVTRVRQLHPT